MIQFITMLIFVGIHAAAGGQEPGQSYDAPRMIGNMKIAQGHMAHRTGIVLDEEGTVYLMTIVGGGQETFFRISRKGAVKEMIMYRGWPYILDHHKQLWALNDSMAAQVRNKLPFISMRLFKTLPLAAGVGLGVYAIGALDGAFIGFFSSGEMPFVLTVAEGALAFYAVDVAYSLLGRSPSSISEGGNYFTRRVAKHVTDLNENGDYDDYLIQTYTRRRGERIFPISSIVPKSAIGTSCAEFLVRLSLP